MSAESSEGSGEGSEKEKGAALEPHLHRRSCCDPAVHLPCVFSADFADGFGRTTVKCARAAAAWP